MKVAATVAPRPTSARRNPKSCSPELAIVSREEEQGEISRLKRKQSGNLFGEVTRKKLNKAKNNNNKRSEGAEDKSKSDLPVNESPALHTAERALHCSRYLKARDACEVCTPPAEDDGKKDVLSWANNNLRSVQTIKKEKEQYHRNMIIS